MSTSKIVTALIVIAVAAGGFFYFQKDNSVPAPETQKTEENNEASNQETNMNQPQTNEDVSTPETAVAVVETSLGSFEITLDGKAAPLTVANFIKLSNEGFYNDLTFHRIVQDPGFHLIQGGDPEGTGRGGPGYTVPAEIGLKHTKGAIATARQGDQVNPTKASSGSQFYIALEDIPFLDGNYTVFGYVTAGMEVVDKIGAVKTDPADMPLEAVIIKTITIKE